MHAASESATAQQQVCKSDHQLSTTLHRLLCSPYTQLLHTAYVCWWVVRGGLQGMVGVAAACNEFLVNAPNPVLRLP